MPVNKDALLRYILIDTRLRKEPQPSLGDLQQFCEKEFRNITEQKVTISRETVKKDIKNMRKIFFAPVDYSFQTNKYFYQVKSYTFLKLPENLIERLLYNLKLQYIFGKKFNSEKMIHFETVTSSEGWENLPIIARAMNAGKAVKLSYKSLNSKRSYEYLLHPYLLKENRNTWYLLGKKDGSGEMKTFALHRIIGTPTIADIEAEIDSTFDAETYFNNSIGITAQSGKPIDIVLAFESSQKTFLNAKPLHKSQKVIDDSDSEFRVSLHVEPSYEVIANILSYGDRVEVISPESLREAVADRISLAYKKYLNR